MWTAHSEEGENFFNDGRYNKLCFGTRFSRGRRKKISTESQANTYPRKGIFKPRRHVLLGKNSLPHDKQRTKLSWAGPSGRGLSLLWITNLQHHTPQQHTFPRSPQPEITQDVMLLLKIPSNITPKNNLDDFLGYSKAKVLLTVSHPILPCLKSHWFQWERWPWVSGEPHTGHEGPFYFKKKKLLRLWNLAV